MKVYDILINGVLVGEIEADCKIVAEVKALQDGDINSDNAKIDAIWAEESDFYREQAEMYGEAD